MALHHSFYKHIDIQRIDLVIMFLTSNVKKSRKFSCSQSDTAAMILHTILRFQNLFYSQLLSPSNSYFLSKCSYKTWYSYNKTCMHNPKGWLIKKFCSLISFAYIFFCSMHLFDESLCKWWVFLMLWDFDNISVLLVL